MALSSTVGGRRSQKPSRPILHDFIKNVSSKYTNTNLSYTVHYIVSVSYTHLDVYKRQVVGKLPLSLNRSSPKTIGLEYSTNQGLSLIHI